MNNELLEQVMTAETIASKIIRIGHCGAECRKTQLIAIVSTWEKELRLSERKVGMRMARDKVKVLSSKQDWSPTYRLVAQVLVEEIDMLIATAETLTLEEWK